MRLDSKSVLVLSIALVLLITAASLAGLYLPGMYAGETLNWQAQSLGQDLVDLFLIVPLLLLTSFWASKKSRVAPILWGGVNLYLVYTFAIYCFDIHFNCFFVVYCAILGLSLYSCLYFFLAIRERAFDVLLYKRAVVRITGIYLLLISCLFYFLWLSSIVPAILNKTPLKELIDTGLVTNPIHVLDLSVILPGLFITAILLFLKKPLGLIMAPVLLLFCALMDITIGSLVIVMKAKGMEGGYSLTFLMAILTVFSIILLFRYLKVMVSSQLKF